MLEGIISFSVRQRLIVIMGTLALLVGGVWAYSQLPIEAFPDVLNQSVQIITQFPGQSAQDVERKVTLPLEKELSGVPRVAQKRSISEFGLSVIYLYFEDGVDKYWARSQVQEKLASATLPAGVQSDLAPMASITGEILRYEIHGRNLTSTQLRTIQDWTLEKEFRSVPGVADVVGYGGKVRSWDILIDPLRLATYGMGIKQVAEAIQNANANAGGNLIDWPNQSFVVRSDGEVRSLNDVENIGLGLRGSSAIRVKDVGKVSESNAPIRGVVGRDDRDDIVQGIILLRKGENPVSVGRLIREKIDLLNSGTLLPDGVKLKIYYDRIELVNKTTKTVGINLVEGLLLVCLLLYLFLRNRYATALVGIVVPLSLCFAFILMVATKTPANLISLGAIDFGIIVDGAVLIVEFVLMRAAHRSSSSVIERSFVDDVLEVARPVFFSMAMIILAYLPIFTLQQVEGKMFSPLAWTISFALLGALVLSLTLIPALLPSVIARSRTEDHEDPVWLKSLQIRYEMALRKCMNHPKKVFLATSGVGILGIVLFLVSGSEFLPELDEGALWIRAAYPHSTSIEEGVKLARKIRKKLKEMDEVRTVVSQLGGPEDGTDPNLFDNCEFFVDLKPKTEWKRFSGDREKLVEYVRRELGRFPGIEFNVSQPIADNVEEAAAGVKAKNAVKIFGPDLAVLNETAAQLIKAIREVSGTADVGPIASMPVVPHLTVTVDRVKVAQSGLNLQDVNDLVEIEVGGKVVTQVYDGEARINVYVRSPEEARRTLEDIRSLPISLPNGGQTKLDRVASVQMIDGPQVIQREDGYRRIGVKFNIEGRDLGSTMKDILKRVEKLKIPAGYFLRWGGEYENQKRAMNRLMVVLPATLLLLGLVLFVLFNRADYVGVLLASLLLSMVGSVGLLFIRGIPFSVSAAVGLLALFGVVTLNGVTLVSNIILKTKGLITSSNNEVAIDLIRGAALERFRPILMTAVLAALGLIPAALSHGIGSETQKPLATAVIGGVFTGLPVILFFLPVAALYFEERGNLK